MAQTFDWRIIGGDYFVRSIAVLLIFTLSASMAFGQTAGKPGIKAIERAKKSIAKVGVGGKARVTVRLHDMTAVKGYVSQAGDDDFTVTNRRNGKERFISYSEVSTVERPIGVGGWIGLGGIVAGVLILVAVARL